MNCLKRFYVGLPTRHQPSFDRVGALRDGFTLIELIVAVGIVTLIAALIFPAISKTRDSAIATKCAANQRIMFSALMSYANDNDNTFPVSTPGTNRWFFQVAKYVPGFENQSMRNDNLIGFKPAFSKIVICPIPEHAGWNDAPGTYGLHEGFGIYSDGPPEKYAPFRLSRISRPSRLPVLCCEGPEKGGHVMRTNGPNPYAQEKYGYSGPVNNSGPGPNHGGKCNFTFLDGHTELRDVTKRDQWPWNDPNVFAME